MVKIWVFPYVSEKGGGLPRGNPTVFMLQKTTPKQPSEARGETGVSVARERLLRLFDEGTLSTLVFY